MRLKKLAIMVFLLSGFGPFAEAKVQVDPSFSTRIEGACNKFPRQALKNQAKACRCIAAAHVRAANEEMVKADAEEQLNWVINYYSSTDNPAEMDKLEKGPLGFMFDVDIDIINTCIKKTK